MEQNSSWKAGSFIAGQEIRSILWNLKAHYLIHRLPPPPIPILRQINLVQAPNPPSNMHFNIILLSKPISSKWFIFLRSHHQIPVCISAVSARARCSASLNLLALITRIIFGVECRSWSSSLCSLLHLPVMSSFLGTFNTLFKNTKYKFFPPSNLSRPRYGPVLQPCSVPCKNRSARLSLCLSLPTKERENRRTDYREIWYFWRILYV